MKHETNSLKSNAYIDVEIDENTGIVKSEDMFTKLDEIVQDV